MCTLLSLALAHTHCSSLSRSRENHILKQVKQSSRRAKGTNNIIPTQRGRKKKATSREKLPFSTAEKAEQMMRDNIFQPYAAQKGVRGSGVPYVYVHYALALSLARSLTASQTADNRNHALR